MNQDEQFEEKRTNLSVPYGLYARIHEQAATDRRTYKPEIIVLLEEAVTAREKRSK